MSVIFAGSMPYEFVNVSALVTSGAVYDPTHVEGAISKTAEMDQALARLFKAPTAQEIWVHAKVFLGSALPGASSYSANVFTVQNASQTRLCGISCSWNAIALNSGTSSIDITSFIARGVLQDLDLHMFQSGSLRIVELYVNGSLAATVRSTTIWSVPDTIIMSGVINSACYYSELVVTEGNVPTIGMRLHSKRPDASLPGLNTFDAGFWGSLANGSMTDGVVTTNEGARVTGGFQAYTGPATPLGIRGIVQSGRYLKNGTLLNLKGQLRINDVNYDTPDYEFDDGNRLLSVWERNPVTNAPFVVGDFAGLQGGFYTDL